MLHKTRYLCADLLEFECHSPLFFAEPAQLGIAAVLTFADLVHAATVDESAHRGASALMAWVTVERLICRRRVSRPRCGPGPPR